jgi:hypothetical protein
VQLITVNNEQAIRYSPNGFQGTDQFRYTVVDQAGVTSTATVTVHVPQHTSNDIVQFSVKITDLKDRP